MPAIVNRKPSLLAASADYDAVVAVQLDKIGDDFQSNPLSTPQKRTLRSNSAPISTPVKWKSPRRSVNASPNSPAAGIERDVDDRLPKISKSPLKKLADNFSVKPNWNPRDAEQMRAVKGALHLSTSPPVVVCREEEQNKVLEFCKLCIKQEKAGSLYICGCPGTGKTLSMGKVRRLLVDWAGENGLQQPDVLVLNCTSLTNTGDIFSKILSKSQSQKRITGTTSPLKLLQNIYSQKPQESSRKMTLIIADELDYLITKDRAVLHDLFMLTTLPFSRCVLIGVANAIDLADRFLPKLKSLNCKPMVITFRAYSKDQILKILEERLMSLPYVVFQKIALELCARKEAERVYKKWQKVAAESGDMRKALSVCRSAIEMLEAELRESPNYLNLSPVEKAVIGQQTAPVPNVLEKREIDIVSIDHMVVALSKTYRSPVVDTIQSLPQHQQIILCSAVKLFRGGKKDTTIGELNKCYTDICKSTLIPPVGVLELSSMCKVLNDQGLLKLGQSREEKFKRVALKIDEEDVAFALQGIRFFRNCLQ